MKKSVFIFFFIFGMFYVKAQNTRSVQAPTPSQYKSVKKENKSLFVKKKNKKTEVQEFRERLKKAYKQKAKEEKLAKKSQYANPAYFGHKKPPKKRPVGEQKFCKTCGIKH